VNGKTIMLKKTLRFVLKAMHCDFVGLTSNPLQQLFAVLGKLLIPLRNYSFVEVLDRHGSLHRRCESTFQSFSPLADAKMKLCGIYNNPL
jgi:hypothetical protein